MATSEPTPSLFVTTDGPLRPLTIKAMRNPRSWPGEILCRDGKPHILEVQGHMTADIFAALEEAGVQMEGKMVFSNGMAIERGKSLEEYDIIHGNTIHVRPEGWRPPTIPLRPLDKHAVAEIIFGAISALILIVDVLVRCTGSQQYGDAILASVICCLALAFQLLVTVYKRRLHKWHHKLLCTFLSYLLFAIPLNYSEGQLQDYGVRCELAEEVNMNYFYAIIALIVLANVCSCSEDGRAARYFCLVAAGGDVPDRRNDFARAANNSGRTLVRALLVIIFLVPPAFMVWQTWSGVTSFEVWALGLNLNPDLQALAMASMVMLFLLNVEFTVSNLAQVVLSMRRRGGGSRNNDSANDAVEPDTIGRPEAAAP